MSWSEDFVLPWRTLDLEALRTGAATAATRFPGTTVQLGAMASGRLSIEFMVPWESLPRSDRREVERFGPGGSAGQPVPIEISAEQAEPIYRADVGSCVLRVHSGSGANGVCRLTVVGLAQALAEAVGGVHDSPRRPEADELTDDGLADLRRMVEALGDVPPSWRARYAPDGDVDAGISRLWSQARLEQLLQFLGGTPVQTLVSLGLEAWKVQFGGTPARAPSIPKVVTAIEWWLDGKSKLPAIERVARYMWQILERPENYDAETYAAASSLDALARGASVSEKHPSETLRLVSTVFRQGAAGSEPALADLLRKRLKPPTLASLRKLRGK